jgi:hypothetical protein
VHDSVSEGDTLRTHTADAVTHRWSTPSGNACARPTSAGDFAEDDAAREELIRRYWHVG